MKRIVSLTFLIFMLSGVTAQGSSVSGNYRNLKPAKVQYGTASFYADKFEGRKTANGERFSQAKMTCAHNTLPLGTWVRVTNLRNKKQVILRVNDRLHPKNPRLVDLSKSAARKLDYTGHGLTKVKVEVLTKNDPEVLALK